MMSSCFVIVGVCEHFVGLLLNFQNREYNASNAVMVLLPCAHP